MILHLVRKWFTEISTVGILYVDGAEECYVLEDRVRTGPKVPGETAIPEGTYTVIIDHSRRFNRDMPLILDVPGFTGIRIHSGNTAANTDGCLLVGRTRGPKPDWIGSSRVAFDALFEKLHSVLRNRMHVEITISHEEEGE